MDNIRLLEASLKSIDDSSKEIRNFVNDLVDEASFVETSTFLSEKSIFENNSALSEGVLTGYASLANTPIYVIAQNSAALSGSLGIAQAKKIIKCMDTAIANGHVLLSILDSSGARVGEGVNCLEAFAMVLAKAAEVRNHVPHIVVTKGNAIGHFAAYLSIADFVFGSKEAIVSFNPPSVLAAKENKENKELFGLNIHRKCSGLFDFDYTDTKDLREQITMLIDYTNSHVSDTTDNPNRESAELALSISPDSLLAALADNGKAMEYSSEYAKEIRCYLTKINGVSVGLVINDREENKYLTLDSVDKVTSFLSVLIAYELPLITLVDSKGLFTSLKDEQTSAVSYAGSLMNIIAQSQIPKIGVAMGNAIGIAYSAFMSKGIGFDYTVAFPDSIISPINADTAVSLIYSNELAKKGNSKELRTELESLFKKERCSPFIAAKEGYIDEVIHPAALRPYLCNALIMLLGL